MSGMLLLDYGYGKSSTGRYPITLLIKRTSM